MGLNYKKKIPSDFEDSYTSIPDYSGYCPDCPECGTTMGYSYIKSEFKCPNCGYLMDEMDWDYECEDTNDPNNPPFGCAACGGPYPDCKSSCNMFDD